MPLIMLIRKADPLFKEIADMPDGRNAATKN